MLKVKVQESERESELKWKLYDGEQNNLLVDGRHLFPNVKSESARKWKEKWEKVKVIWYEQKNLLV